jgi:sec-independent protein translocase protein TatA
MGALSPAHLIVILVIALLVIGPGKLPETGAALGRAIREFRHAVDGLDEASTPAPIAPAPVTASLTPAVPSAHDGAVAAESGGLDRAH